MNAIEFSFRILKVEIYSLRSAFWHHQLEQAVDIHVRITIFTLSIANTFGAERQYRPRSDVAEHDI